MFHTLPSGAQIIEGMRRYSGRDIIRVRIPFANNIIQPFYRSTGHNSGMSGTWFPFDGLLRQGASDNDFWFNKSRFTGDKVKGDLQRFGTQLLKQISDELGRIPELNYVQGKDSSPTDVNTWLGTFAGQSHNATNAGESPPKGAPGTFPGTPVTPIPPKTQPALPSSSGGGGDGVSSNGTPPGNGGSGGSGSGSGSGGRGGSTPSGTAPVIHTVRPLTARAGEQVRLNGARLHLITEVLIGGVPALIYSQDRDLILVAVPENAVFGAARIEARYPGGTINAPGTFTVSRPVEEQGAPDTGAGAAPPPSPSPGGNSSRGAGFWQNLLTDPDVRRAVNRMAPQSVRPFINPLMEHGAGLLEGGEATMSGQMGQVLGLVGGAAGGYATGKAAGTSGILSGAGGLVGGALAGPLGSAIGSAIGTVIEKAVQIAIDNVKEMGRLGGQSMENFAHGALSVTSRVMDVGMQIGDTLLRATLRPFGASGAAIAGFVGTIGQSLKGLYMAGMGLATSGLKAAGSLAGAGLGFGMAVGGALIGTLMGGPVIGLVYGVVGSLVGKLMMSVVNGITGAIGGVFDALGKALGEIGRVGGEALKTLLTVIDDVKNAAMGLSKSILDMSQMSGMSVGASAQAVNNLQGFGISPQQAAQMFSQNVLYQRGMDRAWGIHGEAGSEQNLRETREQYQSLKASMNGNPLLANMMMQSTGKQALIPMANLPEHLFNRSLENGRGLQMGTGAVLEWQQNLGLLQNDLGRFAEFVKVTLGNAFLPSLQRGLGLAVEFFKKNKDAIVDGIKGIGRFFYADLPDMVLGGATKALRGFSTLLRGLASFIGSLGTSGSAINNWVGNFLGGIDRIVYGFREAIAIGQGAAKWLDPSIMPWNKRREAEHARLDSMRDTFQWQTQLQNQWKRATAPQYDAQGKLIPNGFQRSAAGVNAIAVRVDGLAAAAANARKQMPLQQRRDDYDRIWGTMQGGKEDTNLLQKIADNTGRQNTIDLNLRIDPTSDLIAKVLSYQISAQWQRMSARGAGMG